MAVGRTQTQVTWPTSSTTGSVSSSSSLTSEALTFGATTFAASVSVKADNAGTPTSGDTLSVFALYSSGDPDAAPDSADEYDTAGHGELLGVLDTNAEDPVIATFALNAATKAVKIYVENDGASSITVSAQVTELGA